MNGLLFELVGLASAQVIFYRIHPKQAVKTFWLLTFFYFFLFSFTEGLRIFCNRFLISFYELPLLALALFLVFGRGIRGFPRFQSAFREAPDFYLFSGLWVSLIWLGGFPPAGQVQTPANITHALLNGFFQSFFAAFSLPILAGIKERIALLNPPEEFRGLPIFLMVTGIVLLGLIFFTHFSN